MRLFHAVVIFLLLTAFLLGFSAGRTSPTFPSDQLTQSPISTTPSTIAAQSIATPTPTGLSLVTRVLDGDTIEIKGGKRIRYMGIDAPELYEKWGTLAYETNRDLVEGKFVRIEEDHPDRDFYGRTLAHVWINDVFVSERLVDDGLAKVFLVAKEAKPKYLSILQAAEERAKGATRGLWTPQP